MYTNFTIMSWFKNTYNLYNFVYRINHTVEKLKKRTKTKNNIQQVTQTKMGLANKYKMYNGETVTLQ
jgi:hypothetical protein